MKTVAWIIFYAWDGAKDVFDDIRRRLPASRDANCWPWETAKIDAYNLKMYAALVEEKQKNRHIMSQMPSESTVSPHVSSDELH